MKKFLATLLTLFLLIITLYQTNNFFMDKKGVAKYENYLENPERYDVIFMGSSHTVMGILPMEIWQEYGISTYNLGNYGQSLPADFWILKEIFTINKPKLVVVDTYAVMSDDKYSEHHISYLHEIFDNFEYSELKKEAIFDLFPQKIQNDFLFPFSIYHSQWDNIRQELFINSKESYFYGEGSDENGFYGTDTDILVKPQNIVPIKSQSINNTETTGTVYLRKIIELCLENDVDILLTLTPFVPTEEQIEWNNRVNSIANEYGICFYNEFDSHIINPRTDMWDFGHLNSSGAKKWSSALGGYIVNNYNIPQYSKGATFDYWTSLYNDTYMTYKINRIKEQNNLYNYLMLIADKNLSICLYIPENSNIYNDRESIELIKNLSQYKELYSLDYTVNNDNHQAYFAVINNGSGDVWECIDNDSINALDSTFGCVNFNHKQLFITNSENNDWEMTFQDNSDISIVLINEKTASIEDIALFNMNEITRFISDR